MWTAPGDNEIGLRIVVQSERGPVYLEDRVEAFLDHMEGVFERMTDEQFAEQKDGLERKWREVPKNLNEEVSRHWAQVDSGYLDFLRRECLVPFDLVIFKQPTIGTEDADFLGAVSKQDVVSLFLTRVHPSSKTRSKLSIHAQSQKPRPTHVSRAAAEAFVQIAHEQGVNLEDADWSGSLYADGEPSETQFATFWKNTLAEGPAGAAEKVFSALPQLTMRFPAEKDATGSLKEDVVFIKDISAFRKSLQVSEPPKPLVDWNDLPIARF